MNVSPVHNTCLLNEPTCCFVRKEKSSLYEELLTKLTREAVRPPTVSLHNPPFTKKTRYCECVCMREEERIDSLKMKCLPQLCSVSIQSLCVQYIYSEVSASLYLYANHALCIAQFTLVGAEFCGE